jgi:leader peptidase (prepilin peptidase)/N-methyltransferase
MPQPIPIPALITYIVFLFALGAIVGSFLNVVVWRLPRGESLITPPSHCPQCQHRLAWFDNIPVLGWLLLRGRCRYCAQPISARYPIIEFITGSLLVFYFLTFLVFPVSACVPRDWPMYALYMFLICSLLAASLIDAELFLIPVEIAWLTAAVGIVGHTIIDLPRMPGALNVDPNGLGGALAAGGGAGLILSIALFWAGKIPVSFPEGEPALEIDEDAFRAEVALAKRENREPPVRPPQYTPKQIRSEMRKEMLFLLPPMIGALLAAALVHYSASAGRAWHAALQYHWFAGLLGSVLGTLVGGFIVWLIRILGTLAFGRVAMGLGDVHLMLGIGAVIGTGPVVVTFFLAPFAGMLIGIYMFITRRRRELPYGPYLSLTAAAVMLCYCPIADYFRSGVQGMAQLIHTLFGG